MTSKTEFLGEGAFGKVYKVTKVGKVFAVKKVPNTDMDIRQEKELLEMVDHKFIIKYHDSYREGPLFCIEMEYADCGTMTSYLQDQAKLPKTDTVQFKEYNVWRKLWHLSSALDYLHTLPSPVMHRSAQHNILFYRISFQGPQAGKHSRGDQYIG